MSRTAVLGIDVGGTSVKARLIDAADRTLGEWRVATPRQDPSAERTMDVVAEIARAAGLRHHVEALGLVVPGIVREAEGLCLEAVNLGWRDVPVRDMAESATGRAVAFGHDVRAGALAEALSGAAADVAGLVAFVPVGTGVACALVRDGVVLGAETWSGEIGQRVVDRGRHAGHRVEEIASAGGIAARAGERNAVAVARRAASGDGTAMQVWQDAVLVLADALAEVAAEWSPAVVVIGGGLAEAGDAFLAPLRAAVVERVGADLAPPLVGARHGDAAAVVGAVLLARGAMAA